jgi:hypothetical protein
MIELVRPPESQEADAIAETLREMVVAFRVIDDPSATSPVLRDGQRIATTEEEVAHFITELRRDLLLWTKYQSDTCYVDGVDGTC